MQSEDHQKAGQSQKKTLLIAGGGTGGHVQAGVAVAQAWQERWGDRSQILFIGSRGGLEEKLVPRAGLSLYLISIGSLNRVGLKKQLQTLMKLPGACWSSARKLLEFQPASILGVGGYASGPVLLMAKVLRVFGLIRPQIAILEQNSVLGLTNRILSKFVDILFLVFADLGNQAESLGFTLEKNTTASTDPKRKKRALVTGNPIRSQMKRLAPARAEAFTVFIFGGSQGAMGINSLVIEALPMLVELFTLGPSAENKERIAENTSPVDPQKIQNQVELKKLKIIHQTGEKDFERVRQAAQGCPVPYQVEKFIYDMASAYEGASLVLCRSGSSTLSELAAVGRASILIPLPTAADNHQEKNARVFADAGAAVLCRQNDTSGKQLAQLIYELQCDRTRIRKMEDQVTQFYMPHAAQQIADELGLDLK